MRRWHLLLALLLLAPVSVWAAAGQSGRLEFPPQPDGTLNAQAAFLARLLAQGGSTELRLPAKALPSHDTQGAWRPEALEAALSAQGPLVFRGDSAQAAAGLAVQTRGAPPKGAGRWLVEQGLPRVVLVENSSSVSPLSQGLAQWHWPCTVRSFADVEADPAGVLDPAQADLVVISAPGWWGDFANPPGGPSRMGEPVAKAMRAFVRDGGTALFIDVAQWDLEKAWPQTLSLAPLGPNEVKKLGLSNGTRGGISLAPEGVAPDKLRREGAFRLIGDERFDYPDGHRRPIAAAYAMPDPGGGQGWVAGLAFHVFDQDGSLSAASRRILLNMLLLAGSRRLSIPGEPVAPTPPPSSPSPSATPSLPPTPVPTALPTLPPTAMPTLLPTAVPTEVPTMVPTLPPTPWPTPIPTPWPTVAPPVLPPTPWPTAVPTPRATVALPVLPALPALPHWPPATVGPSSTATPPRLPALPSPTPWPEPPRWRLRPSPTLWPTPRPWPTLAPIPWPTLAPTPWPTLRPSPRPRWIRPTALPTLVPSPKPLVRSAVRFPTLAPTVGLIVHYSRPRRARPTAVRPGQQASALLPRPTVVLAAPVHNALGCLASAPEPFTDGGVYLQFCLRQPAQLRCVVYGPKGKVLWRSPVRITAAGQGQVYFGGSVHGVDLSPGSYLFEVQARYADGLREIRQGTLTKVRRPRD